MQIKEGFKDRTCCGRPLYDDPFGGSQNLHDDGLVRYSRRKLSPSLRASDVRFALYAEGGTDLYQTSSERTQIKSTICSGLNTSLSLRIGTMYVYSDVVDRTYSPVYIAS